MKVVKVLQFPSGRVRARRFVMLLAGFPLKKLAFCLLCLGKLTKYTRRRITLSHTFRQHNLSTAVSHLTF